MKNNEKKYRTTTVINDLGMHARPASQIAKLADTAMSEVWLEANDNKVDATSIIDILTLGAIKGTKITVEIKDDKDIKLLDDIVNFF